MYKKIAILVAVIFLFSAGASVACAITVGVKKGDWIEYTVTSTGTLDESHNITSARMEVMDVQGDIIQVNIVSTYSNGTQASTDSTLNLDTGVLIDNFIIPANLTTGMSFNSNMGNMGKMMIGASRQGSYCGATRTVVTATYGGNTYIWDQATGVSVEGNSEGTLNGQAYTMHSLATATNMWQTETPASPDLMIYSVVIVIVIVIVAIVAVVALRSRKR